MVELFGARAARREKEPYLREKHAQRNNESYLRRIESTYNDIQITIPKNIYAYLLQNLKNDRTRYGTNISGLRPLAIFQKLIWGRTLGSFSKRDTDGILYVLIGCTRKANVHIIQGVGVWRVRPNKWTI